ncbi:MAG: indolepyruvate ferredoxin oxidoreductase subunit alpha [Methanomassiliicoccales archaeon]
MIHVDQEICQGCGVCIPSCPEEAIRWKDGKVVIVQLFCRECGLCAENCPEEAIIIGED